MRKRVLADLSVGTTAAAGSSSTSGASDGALFRKSKRNKLLLPEGGVGICFFFNISSEWLPMCVSTERKAYFAVLSLLVDRGLVPPESKGQPLADAEVAEACVPESYRPVLNLLKE
jgi:hypothetical protein